MKMIKISSLPSVISIVISKRLTASAVPHEKVCNVSVADDSRVLMGRLRCGWPLGKR